MNSLLTVCSLSSFIGAYGSFIFQYTSFQMFKRRCSYVHTALFASTALFICKYGSFHSCIQLFPLCIRLFSDAYTALSIVYTALFRCVYGSFHMQIRLVSFVRTALFIVYTALFRCVYSFVDVKIRLFSNVCAALFGCECGSFRMCIRLFL